MKVKLVIYCLFAIVVSVLSSCSSTHKYGNRSDKYSRARTKYKAPKADNNNVVVVEGKEKKQVKKDEKYKVYKASKRTNEDVKREEMVEGAKKYIGIPYKYAGKNPNEGFDCSGFANFIYNENGFKTSGPSYELAMMGVFKEKEALEAGDLVFFGSDNKINHVGMVVSRSSNEVKFIHSSTSVGIKIDEILSSEYWNSKYLFGRDLLSVLLKEL